MVKHRKSDNNENHTKYWLVFIVSIVVIVIIYSVIKFKNTELYIANSSIYFPETVTNFENIINEIIKFSNYTDTFNWFFSAATQTIAAFVGFLLAGYSLVHNAMDSRAENNDELKEIYHDLKKKYYKMIKILFIITGNAIVCNLTMVILNGTNIGCKSIFTTITVIINLISVIF